uniref:Uncharacterized protein n=1 Tax=Amblyomma triste TaxID=251400 RepID=A0A023G2L0_AMBTT
MLFWNPVHLLVSFLVLFLHCKSALFLYKYLVNTFVARRFCPFSIPILLISIYSMLLKLSVISALCTLYCRISDLFLAALVRLQEQLSSSKSDPWCQYSFSDTSQHLLPIVFSCCSMLHYSDMSVPFPVKYCSCFPTYILSSFVHPVRYLYFLKACPSLNIDGML